MGAPGHRGCGEGGPATRHTQADAARALWHAGGMSEPPPDATWDAPAERYVVRRTSTPAANRYEVRRADDRGRELGVLCFAEQALAGEEVTFYTDAARLHPLFGFAPARRRLGLGSGYEVTDSHGLRIGWFRKHFRASVAGSSWTLGLPDGRELVGRERNPRIAAGRLLWEAVPGIGDLPGPFLHHVDFATADGRLALSTARRAGIRDVHRLTLPALADGRPIDWRVGVAMAVALDALQPR